LTWSNVVVNPADAIFRTMNTATPALKSCSNAACSYRGLIVVMPYSDLASRGERHSSGGRRQQRRM
jgi:hypothetical protein